MNLRQLARGKPCMVRIPRVCTWNEEETILAHLNGGKSNSSKNPDLLGAWCCAACHAWLDGGYVKQDYPKTIRDLWHMQALVRTQRELLKLGLQEAIDGWREQK